MKKIFFYIISSMSIIASAQQVLSPETLWKLNRVTALGILKDKKSVVYKVLAKLSARAETWQSNDAAVTQGRN